MSSGAIPAAVAAQVQALAAQVKSLEQQIAHTETKAATMRKEVLEIAAQVSALKDKQFTKLKELTELTKEKFTVKIQSHELTETQLNLRLAQCKELTELTEKKFTLEIKSHELTETQLNLRLTALNGRVKVLEEENSRLKADADRIPLSQEQLRALSSSSAEASHEDDVLEDRESLVTSQETTTNTAFSQFFSKHPQEIALKLLACIGELMLDTNTGFSSHSQGITVTLDDHPAASLHNDALLATVKSLLPQAYHIVGKGTITLFRQRLTDSHVRNFQREFRAETRRHQLEQYIDKKLQEQTEVSSRQQ